MIELQQINNTATASGTPPAATTATTTTTTTTTTANTPLPFTPVALGFRGINYTVTLKDGKNVQLLHDITGDVFLFAFRSLRSRLVVNWLVLQPRGWKRNSGWYSYSHRLWWLPNLIQSINQLLHNNITGYAVPGNMLALMGSSGAGKTTLMDVIAQRKSSGVIEGDITINGSPIEPRSYRRIVGCE